MSDGPSEAARRDPTRRPPEWDNLPPPIERFAVVESLIPAGVMKHQRGEKFEWIPFTIVSYPQGRDPAVYGVFSIAMCALKKGQRYTIKQDFLVYERESRPPIAT